MRFRNRSMGINTLLAIPRGNTSTQTPKNKLKPQAITSATIECSESPFHHNKGP